MSKELKPCPQPQAHPARCGCGCEQYGTEQVSSAWLAQLRSEYLQSGDECTLLRTVVADLHAVIEQRNGECARLHGEIGRLHEEIWRLKSARDVDPEGWRLVTVEPSMQMRRAAQDKLAAEGLIVSDWLICTAYAEMLAAPSPAPDHREMVSVPREWLTAASRGDPSLGANAIILVAAWDAMAAIRALLAGGDQ